MQRFQPKYIEILFKVECTIKQESIQLEKIEFEWSPYHRFPDHEFLKFILVVYTADY